MSADVNFFVDIESLKKKVLVSKKDEMRFRVYSRIIEQGGDVFDPLATMAGIKGKGDDVDSNKDR